MKPLIASLGLGLLTACSAQKGPAIPLSRDPRPVPDLTLVWVGTGTAHRYEGGVRKRTPEFDYEFTVVQRRYKDHWESIKDMHRRHPDYQGTWGPRDQTYSFRLAYSDPGPEGSLSGPIQSTLGDGRFTTDQEFRKSRIEIKAGVSSMAPFNTYRITQDCRYEQGRLVEKVELLDTRKAEGKQSWVENDEEAVLFASRSFPEAPTRK